ncbi:hypothetical protein [Paenibacillus alkalitolerans]|uniref:hypothetical protein n=1 Tax=Paenibacillus alkalitolerans TaxID=2799335 RepID=UPI0018F5C30C|nr:hypothetical protein [Paenibacillus alkalitolerans]
MSYGTILLMAVICFVFGGGDRTPWASVEKHEHNVASTEAMEALVSEEEMSTLSAADKTIDPIRSLSAASSFEEPPVSERQWYAYLRYKAADIVPAFTYRLLVSNTKCEKER